MPKPAKQSNAIEIPPPHNWATTDLQEIERRRERARLERFAIRNREPGHPIFSTFEVNSPSGMTYTVEIRDVSGRQFSCGCVDFRINGLGTCKHVEAVLNSLQARHKTAWRDAVARGSARIEVVPDVASGRLRLVGPLDGRVRSLDRWFDEAGRQKTGEVGEVLEALEQRRKTLPALRLSQDIGPWLEAARRLEERKRLRREYELKVHSGEWPPQETRVPLFPYQREGMLHLAFAERALLADEMGLGKTIQAIAACALLQRLGQARHVLVVTPASLKSEWEEQIQRFTDLPYRVVYGGRGVRLAAYAAAPFFTIVNYEQMRADTLDVNARLRPEVVILDEAQRIKNWTARTTQAIKRLQSRYAFVLTGTPIENRIDELYSLMDFLDPTLLGPLFRFNREYYQLDDRGRPAGYRNLDRLHDRIRPYLLRRRKSEVETELPERTDENRFVLLSPVQQEDYETHAGTVARLAAIAQRRPLSPAEQDRLLRHLAMMRMVCDTTYILNPEDRTCPKLGELEKILEDCRENDAKVIIFSEWERMLELVRDLCRRMDLGHAWHTGSVPQQRRRGEINRFKQDPACRAFLSTDSGAAGLNLQVASVVVNCDLPWNPAKLEQRIARAWRKHQTRPVTVVNLVTENTIEHRMLSTLADKRSLADGVLDRVGNLREIPLRSGRQALLAKLHQLLTPEGQTGPAPVSPTAAPALPADRPLGFAREAADRLGALLVRCEERYPAESAGSVLYVVVERNATQCRDQLLPLQETFFGSGTSEAAPPVRLEVIDRATHEALQRLIDAGLITVASRASRNLSAAIGPGSGPPPLSAEEQLRVQAARALATRKLKMAQVLGNAGLDDEAGAALRDAILPLAQALALESRLPEPATPAQALLPPGAPAWLPATVVLRPWLDGTAVDWKPVWEALHSAAVAT